MPPSCQAPPAPPPPAVADAPQQAPEEAPTAPPAAPAPAPAAPAPTPAPEPATAFLAPAAVGMAGMACVEQEEGRWWWIGELRRG